MPERGATPQLSARRRAVLHAVNRFTSPLLIDDYLELINPLWSSRELRGRVEKVERQTEDASTIVIKPGWEWMGHEPGQYLRIGFDIEGVRHWRAYSLTSDPGDPDGNISITVKHTEGGKVSPYIVRKLRQGCIVTLGEVTGQFTLPKEVPEKLLFISAGSGITPIVSMIRDLADKDELVDVIHLHSSKSADDMIFGDELRKLAERRNGYTLIERHTAEEERLTPDDLPEDWTERLSFASGPGDFLDALEAHWEEHGDPEMFKFERFQPTYGEGGAEGEGGTIRFSESDKEAEADGGQSILVAGEEAGLELDYGCRMGICHTCVGKVTGKVRDLRSGEVIECDNQTVRICINAPEGEVEVAL
jgi:stearoyl-CoA 9-desaturase NADPH oxidoreductase